MSTQDDLLIEKYFREYLNEEEQSDFDKKKLDPDFKQRLLLEKQLFQSLSEQEWSFAQNVNKEIVNDYQSLFESKDIITLKSTLKNLKTDKKNDSRSVINWKPFMYVAAAVALVLIGISTLINSNLDPEELYATYLDKSQLTYSVVRGETVDGSLDNIQQLFFQEKYEEALPLIELQIDKSAIDMPALYLMKGVSLTELKNYQEAIKVYDRLIESNYLDSEKGHWYKGLLYLKKGDVKNAQIIFNKIKKEQLYNSVKAAEILKFLE